MSVLHLAPSTFSADASGFYGNYSYAGSDNGERVFLIFRPDLSVLDSALYARIAFRWRTIGDTLAAEPLARLRVRRGGARAHHEYQRTTNDADDGAVLADVLLGGVGAYVGTWNDYDGGEIPALWPGSYSGGMPFTGSGGVEDWLVTIEGVDGDANQAVELLGLGITIGPPPASLTQTLPYLGQGAALAPDRLGVDIACIGDVEPSFRLAAGVENLCMAIARRLSTPRGSLWYDPEYGLDLAPYLSAAAAGQLGMLGPEIAAEARKDERVASAEARVSYLAGYSRLRVDVRGETAAGPFALILDATRAGVTVAQAVAGT